MRIPFFGKPRVREAVATDRLIQAIQANASTPNVASNGSAGIQIASQIYSSCLSGAKVVSRYDLPPSFLSHMVRELVVKGESVWIIEKDMKLTPVSTHEVRGSSAAPESWTYACEVATPNETIKRQIPRAGLLHFMWAVDSSKPWRGLSPLDLARSIGKLAAKSEVSLEYDHNSAAFYLCPIFIDEREAEKNYDSEIVENIDKSRGNTDVLALTHQSQWRDDTRMKDLRNVRFGPEPNQTSLLAAKWADVEICQVCGIPSSLITDSADAGSRREGFRFFIDTQLRPLTRRIEAELSEGLATPVSIDLTDIQRGDIVGRARAMQSMTKAGMSVEDAARISGILSEED